jgi:predicted phosphodiesterase
MKLGFLSDIHEDIISLQKGLQLLEKEKCDQVICLGDITGFSNPYYPFGETKDANACIRLVRENCSVVVPGNHDLFSAGRIPQFNAGIEYPENWFNLDIRERMNLMKGKVWLYEHEILPELTEENLQYLESLPEYHIAENADFQILFSHFLYPDISGSLIKRIDDIYDYKAHFRFMRQNNCCIGLCRAHAQRRV